MLKVATQYIKTKLDAIDYQTFLKDFVSVLFLLCLPFVVFWFLWAPNPDDKGIFVGDILVGAYPSRVYVHRLLDQGQVPLWNPYQLGGMPLLADVQVAVYYLPNLVLDFLYRGQDIPLEAFEALVVFHYALGAVFMFGYLRNLQVSTWAALLGAVAFEFNGFFVGHHGHYSMFSVVVWVPAILWMLDQAWKHPKFLSQLFYATVAGLFMSQLLMGGHPQLAFYSGLFIFSYFLFRWGMQVQIWRFLLFMDGWRGFITNPIVQMPILIGIAGLLGIGISAIATVPMAELLTRSVRSEPTLAFSSQFSLMPRNFITLLIPEFLNWSGTEFRIFAGVTTLTLVVVSWAVPESPRRPERHFFFGALILAVILSMGGFTSVHGWFYRFLPGFSSVRVSARIFYFANISLVVLASFGAELIFHQMTDRERDRLSRLIKLAQPLVGIFVIIGIMIYGMLSINYVSVGDDFYFYESQFIPLYDNSNLFLFYTQLANHYFTFLIFFVCGLAILWMRATQRVQPAFVIVGMLILMTVDITTFGYQHDVQQVSDLESIKLDGFAVVEMPWWEVQDQEYMIRYLQNLPYPVRIDNVEETLPDNYSQDWGILFSTGYNVLELIERNDFLTRWPVLEESLTRDLMHVHYILTRTDVVDPPEEGAELVIENTRGKVWKRANEPQYAHFSTQFRPVHDGTATNGYLYFNADEPFETPTINMTSTELKAIIEEAWPEYITPDMYMIGATGVESPVDISVVSGGGGEYGALLVDGVPLTEDDRGIHLAVIDPQSGEVLSAEVFDTFRFPEESDRLGFAVESIPSGFIAIMGIYDEGTASLTQSGRQAIRELGGLETLEDSFAFGYGLIGVKGAQPGTAVEAVDEGFISIDVGLGAGSAIATGVNPAVVESDFESSVLRYEQDEIKMLVNNSAKGLLTISETVYPGWKVLVNGEELPIVPSNGMFRGVILPPAPVGGVNEVVFTFEPTSVQIGWIVTLTSLAIAFGMLGLIILFKLIPNIVDLISDLFPESDREQAPAVGGVLGRLVKQKANASGD